MNQYEEIKSLGRGAYAVVRLVRRKADKEKFVVKKFHTAMDEQSARERTEIAQEVKLLAHLSHVNIVKFYDNFVERGIMHIVMEYATGGTLHKRIAMRDGELFEEPQVWEWFVQIVMALKYVHSCNVLHRDLKTQNIMLSGPQQRTIKLGDFGIAKVLGSGRDMAATVVGTPHYLSPELCQGNSYDHKSDVWALGCVLYEICALEKPFDASNIPGIIFKIMRSQPRPIPDVYSDDLRSLVGAMLQNNPADRPSVDDIEAMPIIRHHIKRWKATCKRLRGPLPTPSLPGTPKPKEVESLPAAPSAPSTPTPTATKADMALQQQMLEAHVLESLEKLRSKADNNIAKHRASVQTKLLNLQQQLESSPAPTQVPGRVWEAMGQVWAEAGNFIRAIAAYRRALRSKNATASLGAMEQLGNLAVRFAQKLWQRVKDGEEDDVMREIYSVGSAVMLLGTAAPKDLRALLKEGHERELARAVEAGAAAAKKELGDGPEASGTAAAGAGGPSATPEHGVISGSASSTTLAPSSRTVSFLAQSGTAAADPPGPAAESEPVWRRIAALLMQEGVTMLERLCLIGETAERQSLLGSAYKRQAWTGLGSSRKADLKRAANAYSMAHQLELAENEEDGGTPSPYALLNQVTLEMLAGGGSELLPLVKEAEEWAKAKQITNPADVWLWVQGVDALCLQYLLGDPDVEEEAVAKAYREQFAFGASQRVQSSVMDQFGFMQEVLEGRVAEESAALASGTTLATPMSPKRGRVLLDWLASILNRVCHLRTTLLSSGSGTETMSSPPSTSTESPSAKSERPAAVRQLAVKPTPPSTPPRSTTPSTKEREKGGKAASKPAATGSGRSSPAPATFSAAPVGTPSKSNPFARGSTNPHKGATPPRKRSSAGGAQSGGTPQSAKSATATPPGKSDNPFARNAAKPYRPSRLSNGHSAAAPPAGESKSQPSGTATATRDASRGGPETGGGGSPLNPFSRKSGNRSHSQSRPRDKRGVVMNASPALPSGASGAQGRASPGPTRPGGPPPRTAPRRPPPTSHPNSQPGTTADPVVAVFSSSTGSEQSPFQRPALLEPTRSGSGRTVLPPLSSPTTPGNVPVMQPEPKAPPASRVSPSQGTIASTMPVPDDDSAGMVIVKSKRGRKCAIF